MKNFLMGTAIILVCLISITTSFDSKMLLEKIEELKFITQELSATGTLFINYESFSEGFIEFNDKESIKAIEGQIKQFMNLDSNNIPLSKSYWQDKVDYKVYFYDDSRICRVYNNNSLSDTFSFDYPYIHNSEELDHKVTVADPTVVVIINGGKPRFRIKSMQEALFDKSVVRASSYIWKDRELALPGE